MEIEGFTQEMLTRQSWFDLVRIDPEAAQMLLNLNDRNRRPKPNRVKQYADAMTAGSWQIGADALSIEAGRLVNGQHRCKAVILSGVSIVVPVMVNVGVAFDVLDNGAPRGAADVLFLAGLSEHPDALARAAKLYLAEAGIGSQQARADNQYVEKWVIDNAELDGWVTWAMGIRHASKTPLAQVIAVPAAVLGFAVETCVQDARVAHPYATHGQRFDAGERVPDLDTLRAFLHTMMTRTGVEEGSVEEVLTGHLERWRDRAATDRRTAGASYG
jgi:hypothetical protein